MRPTRPALLTTLLLAALAHADDAWRAETALTAAANLNGCAIGDLDPRYPGNEIAAVSANGDVFVVRRDGTSWKHERVAHLPGEMVQCAIGDVDPAHAGNELVVVGMKAGEEAAGPGAAHVIRLEGDAWRHERIFEDEALIHGVCIGDLDPARAGNEILCVGFSERATLVARDGEAWKTTPAGDLLGAGKTAVIYQGGAAVACQSGALLHVRKADGVWSAEVLDRAPGGLARIATDGTRILTGRDDGALGLFDKSGRTDIHREEQKLRGAALADLDPDAPGLEAATAGYSGQITVLSLKDGTWQATTVFTDTGKFHHLTSGELPGCGKGVELAGCGFSKRLTVVFASP